MKLKNLLRSLVMVSALNSDERKTAFDSIDDCIDELLKKATTKNAPKAGVSTGKPDPKELPIETNLP